MTHRVIPLLDGAFEMETRLFPQVMAHPHAAAALMGLKTLPLRIDVPVWAFVIETSEGPVLVDAGGGAMMGPGFGAAGPALRAAGFDPAEISRVLLTHLHGDHCGGLLNAGGGATFPNARIALSRKELVFWTGPGVSGDYAAIAADAKNVLDAYRCRIDAVEPGERMGAAEAMDAAGHTPGHLGWGFARAGVIAAGDIIHVGAVQIARPGWGSDWDMDPEAATVSRRRLIALARARGADLLCAHGGRIRLDD